MNAYEHLRGRRYIKLIRCSDPTQADTSPEDQDKVLTEFATEHGLIHAGDDVVLAGVTGSLPAARTDIAQVIKRKEDRDDFDLLLIQDFARFTRGGIHHGNALVWKLAEADIEVVYVNAGTTGDPDHDALIETIGYFGAQQQAKALSFACTRGQMSALAAGFIPHTCRMPYGIDRLYVGIDGKKRHRIRNFADGTQQMLAVESDMVLATYGRNPKIGAPVHYKRQSDEKIVLIPGAPEEVDTVRLIFKRRLVEGKGTYLIANELNDLGIPSPTGLTWYTDSVESIVQNPAYTGVGIAARYATGLYHLRGKEATPVALPRDLRQIARKTTKTKALRPKDNWKWQLHPLVADYLGADLRELAVAYQAREFEKQHQKAIAPKTKEEAKPGGDRHGASAYVLKGILTSKQGHHAMSGRMSGPTKETRRRYYAIARARSAPQTDSVLKAMIPAEPLEHAVLNVVKDVILTDQVALRQRIADLVKEQVGASDLDRRELDKLIAKRTDIEQKLSTALSSLGPASQRLMQPKLDQWEAEVSELERRIEKAKAPSQSSPLDAAAVTEQVVARLAKLAESLDGLPPAAVRTLLATLVTRLEVDLATREVEMDLAIPHGIALDEGGDAMCLVRGRLWPSPNEAQRSETLKIASYECKHHGRGRQKRCFSCSRKAA